MMKKVILAAGLSLLAFVTSSCFAGVDAAKTNQPRFVSAPIAELAGSVNVENLQFCADQVKKTCNPRQDFNKWTSCVENTLDANKDKCVQAGAIYNSQKLFYDTAQAAGPVTIFTIVSIGDGATTYYMIDHEGRIISLANEQDDAFKNNAAFQTLLKKNPGAMVMDVEAPKGVAVPKVVMPKAKAKHAGVKIIFPQTIKTCRACPVLGTAEVAYRFDQAGNFLDAKVLKIKKT